MFFAYFRNLITTATAINIKYISQKLSWTMLYIYYINKKQVFRKSRSEDLPHIYIYFASIFNLFAWFSFRCYICGKYSRDCLIISILHKGAKSDNAFDIYIYYWINFLQQSQICLFCKSGYNYIYYEYFLTPMALSNFINFSFWSQNILLIYIIYYLQIYIL